MISAFILGPLTLAIIILGGWFFKILLALVFGLAVREWVRMARQGKAPIRDSALGVLYLLLSFFVFMQLRLMPDQGLFLTLSLIVGIWGSDVFAYFSGKFIGGPKLAATISPNKTWAGFVGGMIGSALVLFAMNMSASYIDGVEPFMPWWLAIIVGALFTVLGQAGDLLVSSYKRRVGVKDTGGIIPGHGGILDRIDSALMVVPFFFIVIEVL